MEQAKKHRMIKDTALYACANYIAQGLGMVNSVALRRFLGPASMGVWSILQVVLGYCGYASFGTTKAMARDYPFLRGKGEHEQAENVKDMTLTFSMLMSFIPALILAGYLLMRGQEIDARLRMGLVFLTVFLFVQRFYDLVLTLLRSDKKFSVLSGLMVLNAAGTLAVTFLFVYRWNIAGLLAGTALVTLGCLGFIYGTHPYHFRYYWEKAELFRELKLGLPLVGIGFLLELLKSMDRWILAKHLGFHDVGLYSMAMMVNSYVYSLPMMFAHVWYPNLQHEFGARGSAEAVKNYLLTPMLILSAIVPLLCGLAIFFIPWLAEIFLPKFTAGIPAMKIYLFGTFFLLLAQFSSNFLVTLDRYWVQFPILAISLGLNYGTTVFFLHSGWGIAGAALGSSVSFFFYGLATYIAALSSFAGVKQVCREVFNLLLALGCLFMTIWYLDLNLRAGRGFALAFLKSAVLLGAFSPFCFILEKKTSFFSTLIASNRFNKRV